MYRKEDYVCLILNINLKDLAYAAARAGLIKFIENLKLFKTEQKRIVKYWNDENMEDLTKELSKIYKRNLKNGLVKGK